MTRNNKHIIVGLAMTGILAKSCVEPFQPETFTFESALVIEATITNELKTQSVVLSRSFAFEDDSPSKERSATLIVDDDQGNEYHFVEVSPGVYNSEQPFAAVSGRKYHLHITTKAGRNYASEPTALSPEAELQSVYAERINNNNGAEGVAIRVNAGSASGNSRNYRYTYEETYKIIAPYWTPDGLMPDPEGGCGVSKVTNKSEEQTCYATDGSRDLILTDTNNFSEDALNGFMVRFLNRKNPVISYRYSILVRQFVQSDAAYTFFETLKEFSGSESVFSQTQPGYLEGNVFSGENAEEKVLGYFDVSPVTEKRIFFNYDDFFPGEPLPPYFDPCNKSTPPLAAGNPPRCVLGPQLEAGLLSYADENAGSGPSEGPYIVVPRVCGDCSQIGSKNVPAFWVEE